MNREHFLNLGNHPERMIKEGVKVHYNQLVRIGESVEAIAEVADVIKKGDRCVVKDILIGPGNSERGFSKRIVFEGIEGDFNPQRFKKVER
jgi:hypothetical protein